jgi:hypothetical protein
MANKRKSMRKVREVLRLALAGGLNQRQVARSLSLSPTTVGEYLRRAERAGLTWPLPDLDDAQLEGRLYPIVARGQADTRAIPDWAEVHRELKRKGVTLLLLWQEHKAAPPMGCSTASSATVTAPLPGGSTWSCASTTAPARSCSSITPDRRWRSSIVPPGRSARRRSLSPPWGRVITPTPKPPGPRARAECGLGGDEGLRRHRRRSGPPVRGKQWDGRPHLETASMCQSGCVIDHSNRRGRPPCRLRQSVST